MVMVVRDGFEGDSNGGPSAGLRGGGRPVSLAPVPAERRSAWWKGSVSGSSALSRRRYAVLDYQFYHQMLT